MKNVDISRTVWSCFLQFELTMGSEGGISVTQSPGGNYLNLANINHYTPDTRHPNSNGASGAKNLIDN